MRAGLGGMTRRAGSRRRAAGVWACLPQAIATTTVDAAVELLAEAFGESSGSASILPQRFDPCLSLAVTVDSPMAEADHVRRVSAAAGNPFPGVASVHFTPANGRASASTRIRLNEGKQEVVAVAELSDSGAWLSRRTIEVAISGCSTETGAGGRVPSCRAPCRGSRVPVEARRQESSRSGHDLPLDGDRPSHRRRRPSDPRRIINRMVCLRDGEPIFAADLTPAICERLSELPMVARPSPVFSIHLARGRRR